MSKLRALFIIIPFILIISTGFILNLIHPDKERSTIENRNLAQKSSISLENLNQFPTEFETYYNDQFIFRDEILALSKKLEWKLGKTRVGNYYIIDNNLILDKPADIISDSKIEKYADTFNKLANLCLDKSFYFVATPHKSRALSYLYPSYVENSDSETININNFINHLNSDLIETLDLGSYFKINFNNSEREKLYYATDHHWTGTGAFEGFKQIIKKMKLELTEEQLDNYFKQYITTIVNEPIFIGSYNKALGMMVENSDHPDYIHLKEKQPYIYSINGEPKKENQILATFRGKDYIDYGRAYIQGSHANILKITNENALTTKKILIFRDSYQAPTTWLFADIFTEVEIADPRNIDHIDKTYLEIIEDSQADIILFLFNDRNFPELIEKMLERDIY